jgi:hypothetical protein
MLERRQVQRGRTFLGGCIAFGHPGFTIDCVVRDMSPNGAKVIFSDAIPVPNEVDLVIERYGKTHRAHFVWRRGSEAGVVFPDAEVKSRVVLLDQARQRKSAGNDRERLQARIAEVTRER